MASPTATLDSAPFPLPDQVPLRVPDARYLSLPATWDVFCGCDTGTYMSAVICAVPNEPPYAIYALAEFPNYRYVGTEIELLTEMSMAMWTASVIDFWSALKPERSCSAWADPNSQFKAEFAHLGIYLRPNNRGLEVRTEVLREYRQANRLWLAPWLQVLPYELERARWPDQETAAGTFRRQKSQDHTLDCLEHCASRRPRGRKLREEKPPTLLDKLLAKHGIRPGQRRAKKVDPHLGIHT